MGVNARLSRTILKLNVKSVNQLTFVKPKDLSYFYGVLRQALDASLISTKEAFDLLKAISNGQISLTEAYKLINDLVA